MAWEEAVPMDLSRGILIDFDDSKTTEVIRQKPL